MNDFFEKKTTVDRSPQEIDQQTGNLVKMWKQRTRYPTKTKERITEEEVRITEILKDPNKRILSLGSGTSLRDYEKVVRVDFNDKFRPTVIADINEPLRFGDGTFDVVVASYVLPWLIDPVRTINEMLRVVKKDGLVIFNGVQPIKDRVL